MVALADGRRDPADPRRPRPVVTVRVLGAYTMEFSGCDHAVLDAIKAVGAKYQRGRGVWLVRGADADEVEALLAHRGYVVWAAAL
jgi:hypothetical protein